MSSMALNRYLCHNIVGTDNHLKTIRLLNDIRYNVSSTEFSTDTTNGSYGEGIEMKGSDLDMMFVLNFAEVFENVTPDLNSNKNILQWKQMMLSLVLPSCNYFIAVGALIVHVAK